MIKKTESYSFEFKGRSYGPYKTQKEATNILAGLISDLEYTERVKEIEKLLFQNQLVDFPLSKTYPIDPLKTIPAWPQQPNDWFYGHPFCNDFRITNALSNSYKEIHRG